MNPLHLLHRLSRGLASRFRNVWYSLLGVKIEGYVWMRRVEIPRLWSSIRLENQVSLDTGVTLLCSGEPQGDKLVIRSGTYVNRYTMFDAHQGIEIGNNCMIGPHCYITDGDHGTALGRSVKSQLITSSPIVIEDEVWMGAGVIVLRGVRIGRGAVIGAGAVVTRDVLANSVALGIPARVVRQRGADS